MLCRCVRVAAKKCAGAVAVTGISSTTLPRLRPPVPCVSVMTSTTPVGERRVLPPPASAQNGIVPRASMSAMVEEPEDDEDEKGGLPEVPVMFVQLRQSSEQGSAGARRCRKGALCDPCRFSFDIYYARSFS